MALFIIVIIGTIFITARAYWIYLENKENNSSEINYNNTESKKEISYINASNHTNKVANKFALVVLITKIVGYSCAIICGLICMSYGNVLFGLLIIVSIAIIVWFSTLIFEAITETLHLLQDIKNKIK